MSFTAFSFISLMPLALFLGTLENWYNKLFSPQVSIACTLFVCLIVIWVTGALFDKWFKNKKLLLAIIKTAIIGVILFSVMKASSTGKGGGDEKPNSEQEKTESEETETGASEENADQQPLAPEQPLVAVPAKTPVSNITITYSNNGVTIDYDGTNTPLSNNPKSQDTFNILKNLLKDDQCFGKITIKLEEAVKGNDTLEGNIKELKKLLIEYNLKNNGTGIEFND